MSLTVDDRPVDLNPFTARYLFCLLRGMADGIGRPSDSVVVEMDDQGTRIVLNGTEIGFAKDFVPLLVSSTIRGALSPLDGIFWLEKVSLRTIAGPTSSA